MKAVRNRALVTGLTGKMVSQGYCVNTCNKAPRLLSRAKATGRPPKRWAKSCNQRWSVSAEWGNLPVSGLSLPGQERQKACSLSPQSNPIHATNGVGLADKSIICVIFIRSVLNGTWVADRIVQDVPASAPEYAC